MKINLEHLEIVKLLTFEGPNSEKNTWEQKNFGNLKMWDLECVKNLKRRETPKF